MLPNALIKINVCNYLHNINYKQNKVSTVMYDFIYEFVLFYEWVHFDGLTR